VPCIRAAISTMLDRVSDVEKLITPLPLACRATESGVTRQNLRKIVTFRYEVG
jgi:hypothetical protein